MIELIAGDLGSPLYPIILTYRLRLLIFTRVVALLLAGPGPGVAVVAVLLLPELHLLAQRLLVLNSAVKYHY